MPSDHSGTLLKVIKTSSLSGAQLLMLVVFLLEICQPLDHLVTCVSRYCTRVSPHSVGYIHEADGLRRSWSSAVMIALISQRVSGTCICLLSSSSVSL